MQGNRQAWLDARSHRPLPEHHLSASRGLRVDTTGPPPHCQLSRGQPALVMRCAASTGSWSVSDWGEPLMYQSPTACAHPPPRSTHSPCSYQAREAHLAWVFQSRGLAARTSGT